MNCSSNRSNRLMRIWLHSICIVSNRCTSWLRTCARALSGIVSGNVKETGIQAIEQHGPFELSGDAALMDSLDKLLQQFVEQRRMKLNFEQYRPLLSNSSLTA